MVVPIRKLFLALWIKILLLAGFTCLITLLQIKSHFGVRPSFIRPHKIPHEVESCLFDLPATTPWYEWKRVNDQIYLFSAFIESSADSHNILIIGISSMRRAHHLCRIWSIDLKSQIVVKAAEQRYLSIHNKKFLTWTYKCQFGVDELPHPGFVSIVEATCQSPSFHLVLQNSFHPTAWNHVTIKLADDDRQVNMTACLSPLNNDFSSHRQLIEWIEVNRFFGVDRFVVYNHSSSVTVGKVLKHYEEKEILYVVPWKIPVRVTGEQEEIHYFGQTTSINDCFHRSRNFSKFIINVDVDEILVPRKSSTYMEMLQRTYESIESKVNKSEMMQSSCHVVRSSFFRVDKSRDFFIRNQSNQVIDGLKEEIFQFDARTLWVTIRDDEIFPAGHRSKLIVGCKYNVWLDIHASYREAPSIKIPHEDCLLHHYRTVVLNEPNANTLVDERMHKFAPEIIDRLKLLYNEIKTLIPLLETPGPS